jgi:hypothetical protein
VEAPRAHVLVEISQVWVVIHRFVEWLPTQVFAQHPAECGFADTDVAGDGDEALAH